MTEPPEVDAPRPFPRDWLPDPHPPDGAPEWEARTRRIMAAADPGLRRLASRRAAPRATWWSAVGLWWKPAAALAVAATALLVLTDRPSAFPEPPPGSVSLSLVAAEGDPVTLWGAFGIQADPVLALIASRPQWAGTEPGTPNGEIR